MSLDDPPAAAPPFAGAVRSVPFWLVDAFSGEAWRGNPAGVCVLDGPAPDAWMAAVAAEVNAAETAFLSPGAGPGEWALRWFTPATEVDLCGHATLAGAHTLWSYGLADGPLAFSTRSGVLRAEGRAGRVGLDFPALAAAPADLPAGVSAALGAPVRWAGRNQTNWLVELADAAAVRALAPDMAGLVDMGAQGLIVTAQGEEGSDFVSRYFAPAVGVPEDPVTGSAHCTLAPFWAARLGRDHLRGHQVSRRGGWVEVAVAGDRVVLTGEAVTVIAGAVRGW